MNEAAAEEAVAVNDDVSTTPVRRKRRRRRAAKVEQRTLELTMDDALAENFEAVLQDIERQVGFSPSAEQAFQFLISQYVRSKLSSAVPGVRLMHALDLGE